MTDAPALYEAGTPNKQKVLGLVESAAIVHDAGDRAVMETLEAVAHITASARAIISSSRGHAFLDAPDALNTCALVISGRCCGLDPSPRTFGAALVISFTTLRKEL